MLREHSETWKDSSRNGATPPRNKAGGFKAEMMGTEDRFVKLNLSVSCFQSSGGPRKTAGKKTLDSFGKQRYIR